MHAEPLANPEEFTWIYQAVCFLCSNRIDRQIIRNRIAQRRGTILRPRLLKWTPQDRITPVIVVGW